MTIGILSADTDRHRNGVKVFRQGMSELGYGENRSVRFQELFAKRMDLFPEAARALVNSGVNVLVAFTTQAAMASKAATNTIPIVFAVVSDPVDAGLVLSLSCPGGNATGLALMQQDLNAKQLQLLKEIVPNLSHVGVLWNATHRGKILEFRQVEIAARTLGVKIVSAEVRTTDDFKDAFGKLARNSPQGIIVLSEPLVTAHSKEVVEFVAKRRLPSIGEGTGWAQAGFLMSYAPNTEEQYRRAATYVDRIIKGARPATIAVERPRKFEWVVNNKTARTLGLTVPPSLLLRADQVIE